MLSANWARIIPFIIPFDNTFIVKIMSTILGLYRFLTWDKQIQQSSIGGGIIYAVKNNILNLTSGKKRSITQILKESL